MSLEHTGAFEQVAGRGRPPLPPEKKKEPVCVYIEGELVEALHSIARERETTLSQMTRLFYLRVIELRHAQKSRPSPAR